MTVSDDIFQLIRSLNKNEKTYFKKFAQLHVLGEGNQYIELFNAIDEQETYDERVLAKRFSKGKSSSQFSVLKNYLYNLILKSLRNYHADISVRAELRQQLQNLSILHERGLREQAEKLLRRCRKTAELCELFRELIEISGIEQTILLFGKSYDVATITALNTMLDERTSVLQKMQNTYDYDRLEYNLSHYLQLRTQKGRMEVSKLMRNSLLKSEERALCVVSRLKFHHIHSTFFYYNQQRKECALHLQKEIEILEAHPEIMRLRMVDYVFLTNNVLLLLLELGDFNKFDSRVARFRIQLHTLKISARLWGQAVANNWLIEMQRHYAQFDYAKILSVANDLQQQLKANRVELNLSDHFLYLDLLTRASFVSGKFDAALDYSIQILNHAEAPKKFNQFNQARLLNLLIHFELGNFDLLDYQIQSFQRQVVKPDKENPLYKAILPFLKKYPSAIDRKEKRALIEKLTREVTAANSQHALVYFDFAEWAEQKR